MPCFPSVAKVFPKIGNRLRDVHKGETKWKIWGNMPETGHNVPKHHVSDLFPKDFRCMDTLPRYWKIPLEFAHHLPTPETGALPVVVTTVSDIKRKRVDV